MMSGRSEEMDLLALGCFLLAMLVLCTALGLATIWWFRAGRPRLDLLEWMPSAPAGPQADPPAGGWSGPELMLAERFAKGDIDDREYRRRLETLRTASGGPPSKD